MNIQAGDVFEVDYPFSRSSYIDWSDEDSKPVPCWRPGYWTELEETFCPYSGSERDGVSYCCNGWGKMIFEVVSTHKPGKYPERIFYLRRWRDPNGKEFGKNKLFTVSKGGFTKRLKGLSFEFEVTENTEKVTV